MWFVTSSLTSVLLYAQPIAAQVIPDDTLPMGERSQVSGNPNFQIDGGARRGGNLFHSFQQLSVPTGGSAFFNNAADVRNIFSRVTGRSVSSIDGVIRANGTANLFLLNPNGILFGPNARLNIGGSFIATTANSINFADNFQYSATNPQTAPLLTVSVPVGLQMGATPGQISLQGNGYDLSVSVPIFSPIVRGSSTAGLRVPVGQTLALIGGDIDINGGTLTAEQGRIELGSVRNGQVNLSSTSSGFAFDYQGSQRFGNICLSQQALADASGGGLIQVQGSQVLLTDGSLLFIRNQGSQTGGSINVNVTRFLELSGTGPGGSFLGGLSSQTVGIGRGADITVLTQHLLVRDAAGIQTDSHGPGRSGNVVTQASDSIQVTGFSPLNLGLNSSIGTGTYGSGGAGDVTLLTRELTVLEGGTIGAGTYGIGRGGNVTLSALDFIKVSGQSALPSVSNLVAVAVVGDAGRLTVNTSRLILQDGGTVATSTLGGGNAGSLIINASEAVELNGTALGRLTSSFLGSSAPILPELVRQVYRLPDRPSGNSGSVTINTPRLSVMDGAEVTVSNDGAGSAGTLRVNANSIVVDRGGSITAATASGEGGNINLNVRDSILLRGSPITTSAGGTGNGGTINITAGTLSLLGDARLSTIASGVGNAGDIIVSADAVRLSRGAQLRTSTSSRGQAGNLTLNTPILQLSGRNSGLFAGTTSTGNAGNLTIQPRGNGQTVRVELDAGAQISASTSGSGRGGRLTITAPDSITLTGDGSIISAETSGRGIGGNLTLRTGNLNIQDQAEVTVSSTGTGSAGNLFVEADRILLNNGGRIRADTSGGGGNISLRSPLIVLRNGSNITTNATGRNIPGGDIGIDTGFLVAVPNEDSNISANSENFRGGNVSINAIALYGIQPSFTSTPLSDITATGATTALPGTVDVTTATIDPTAGLLALPTDVADASELIARGCPANEGNSFVITGRGGLPPTPEQQLDDDVRWQDRRTLVVPQAGDTGMWRHGEGEMQEEMQEQEESVTNSVIEATEWQTTPTGEVILIANSSSPTEQTLLSQAIACNER
jgi:filamentous hemagglutinin family protein